MLGALAHVVRITRLAIAFAAVAGCAGELIRLGDGPTGADAFTPGQGEGGSGETSGAGGSGAGSAGSEDGASCQRGQVQAGEVLWIGDSWVTIPDGTQHTRVRDYARAAGAIGPDEDYVVRAAAASSLATIVTQYNTQESGPTPVEVLIMDGGTWDTILSEGSTSSVNSVLATFRQFLAKVATDGTVQHIIYYLVPELSTIAGVAALRPGLKEACDASAVPCYFIDLQPLWVGHPDYTDNSNRIQASELGAEIIADAIWATMQEHCIAQ